MTTQPTTAEKADGHLLEAIEGFLLSRRVGNCTERTLGTYRDNLNRFAHVEETSLVCSPLVIQKYLTTLQARMKPITAHQHFRVIRIFFTWCAETGLRSENPMRGVTMRVPKTLPRVPEDEDLRRLLVACPGTLEGRRNKGLVAMLADGGLRISEALRLRTEDVNFATRTLTVRGGKGQKDGMGFFGAGRRQMVRSWIQSHRGAHPEDFVFVDRNGRPLSRGHACRILHRLSTRTGLSRKVGPHALRHYAATSILKQTGDLELVRQVLRHKSLTMALRYAQMTKPEVSRKFRRASPLDTLRAGWLFNYFGHVGVTGLNIGSIIVAFIGGVILLWIIRAVTGTRARV